MMCLSRNTHQMVVNLEQHTSNKLSRSDQASMSDQASIDRWFSTNSKLIDKARFTDINLLAFLLQSGNNS